MDEAYMHALDVVMFEDIDYSFVASARVKVAVLIRFSDSSLRVAASLRRYRRGMSIYR
jgi:hypothetical protein